MTIEILCSGCEDCDLIRGKVCQALADLNLNASVVSIYDPTRTACDNLFGQPVVVIDGHRVTTGSDWTVQQIKRFLDAELRNGH